MAKPPKLKVFTMPAGFYDAVVAVPSRAAALRAWGTSTDLFTAGRASEVSDDDLRAEALARPGEVIRKPRGDEAAMLGPEPDEPYSPAPPPAPARRKLKPKAAVFRSKPPPKPPDRSALDAAEKALAEAEQALESALREFEAERDDLDRRETEARRKGEQDIAAKRGEKERAQTAYERVVAANDNPTRP